MLIFTNRDTQGATDPSAFTTRFAPGATNLGLAAVARDGNGFRLSGLKSQVSDDQALQSLVPVFTGSQRVLVYLHGNNNSPSACFERCARLEEIYGLAVIGFSWPSEGLQSSGDDLPGLVATSEDKDGDSALLGVKPSNRTDDGIQRKIRRYHQAKDNASDGKDAMARFLRLLATARLYANQQKMSLAAHSLGAHYLQSTLDVSGALESLGAMQNIALLAACCRASGHASWVSQLQPPGQVFITFNKPDLVLYGARIADNNQIKLGAEPTDLVESPKVRYVSFTNAQLNFGGHSYFVRDAGKKVPKVQRKLFGRMFGSERDVQVDAGESPGDVYPLNCDADGVTCYMAVP